MVYRIFCKNPVQQQNGPEIDVQIVKFEMQMENENFFHPENHLHCIITTILDPLSTYRCISSKIVRATIVGLLLKVFRKHFFKHCTLSL